MVNFLIHVPKCAGSTVESFVDRYFGDHAISPVKQRSPRRWVGPYYQLPAGVDFGKVEFVMGHYFGRSIARYFEGRQIRHAILLRDPVSYLFSYYNYRMVGQEARGLNLYDFELYYRSRPLNPVSFFILNRYLEIPRTRLAIMSAESKFAILENLLSGFWHVGPYHACGDLIARIAEEHGVDPTFERRNTAKKHFIDRTEFQAEWGDRIRAENALDQRLYDQFCGDVAAAPVEGRGAARHMLTRPAYSIRARIKRDHGV